MIHAGNVDAGDVMLGGWWPETSSRQGLIMEGFVWPMEEIWLQLTELAWSDVVCTL